MESQPSLPEKKNILPAFSQEISQLFSRFYDTVFASEEECTERGTCSLNSDKDNQELIAPKNILDQLRIAEERLADELITKRGKKEEIALAVLQENDIAIVRAERWDHYFPLSSRTMEIIFSKNSDYLIERFAGGGRNTYYRVEQNGEIFPLLAVKRFDEFGNIIIYVPFSAHVAQKELVDSGIRYIDTTIEKAFEEIVSLRVPSIAYPGKNVGEVQQERQKFLIKALLINEQLDPHALRWGPNPELFIERILVIYGANQDIAYSHSKSSAAASGIGQFMFGTYLEVVAIFPAAKLVGSDIVSTVVRRVGMKDFLKNLSYWKKQDNFKQAFSHGTGDHINSIKAMLCLFDYYLGSLDPKVKSRFQEDPRSVEMYIPMFYNGGFDRTQDFIDIMRDRWDKEIDTSSPEIGNALKDETIIFLKKFKDIRRYFEERAHN